MMLLSSPAASRIRAPWHRGVRFGRDAAANLQSVWRLRCRSVHFLQKKVFRRKRTSPKPRLVRVRTQPHGCFFLLITPR